MEIKYTKMSNKFFKEQNKNYTSLLKNELYKDIFNIILKADKAVEKWVFLQEYL